MIAKSESMGSSTKGESEGAAEVEEEEEEKK